MPSYTLGQAARTVGRAKSTISRDLKTGKLSAERQANGSVLIDAAELHRVYGMAVERSNGLDNVRSNDQQPHRTGVAVSADRREIEQLRERLVDKDETIRDLRARLDAEAEERRRLTALLTDQRTKAEPPASAWGRFMVWRRGR